MGPPLNRSALPATGTKPERISFDHLSPENVTAFLDYRTPTAAMRAHFLTNEGDNTANNQIAS